MKNFLLLVALILSFAFDARADLDATSAVICKIMSYTHGIGGPMITIVIIGAALLAIFGRMPWPALFALGAFTAVFFGAPAVVSKIAPDTASKCVCMVPESDGILSSSFKESLWDRYYMGAPKQHRRFVEQYKIEKRA